MKLNVFKTEEELLERLAQYFAIVAQESISAHGRFSVSLAGGGSPKKLYEMLASDFTDKINWNEVYFFFGDERFVPRDHADSNYLMVKTALFDPLDISERQIFAVDTSVAPVEAAGEYTKAIKDFFKGRESNFDLVLLGLGDDAHTASLFPGTPVLKDEIPAAKEVYLENKKVYRITLNAPLINQAYHIAFLVFGEGKAEAVHHVIEDETDISKFPAQLIKPVNGKLQWFLDTAAASNLANSGWKISH